MDLSMGVNRKNSAPCLPSWGRHSRVFTGAMYNFNGLSSDISKSCQETAPPPQLLPRTSHFSSFVESEMAGWLLAGLRQDYSLRRYSQPWLTSLQKGGKTQLLLDVEFLVFLVKSQLRAEKSCTCHTPAGLQQESLLHDFLIEIRFCRKNNAMFTADVNCTES